MKKFELLPETRIWRGRIVHRIRAVRDFGCVRQGDLGGFVESSDNLSHHGDCWIYNDAIACDNARLYQNAAIYNNAVACDYTVILNEASLWNKATARGFAVVGGCAMAMNSAIVEGQAAISDYAVMRDEAVISGKTMARTNIILGLDANVSKPHHFLNVGPIGSRDDYTSFFRNSTGGISVICGCFSGDIDDFVRAVKSTHPNGVHTKAYLAAIKLAKIQILRS